MSKKEKKVVAGSLKEHEIKRRQVYKPILDNPFTQSNLWPFVEPDAAQNVLDHLTVILSGLGNYNKIVAEAKAKKSDKFVAPKQPDIAHKITVGFNSTVKALEAQAGVNRTRIQTQATAPAQKPSHYIRYVFVTKFDIMPAILTNPFPVLCFTASVADCRVKLVQLPRGSMESLSKLLNVENTGIIGLTEDIPLAQALYDYVNSSIDDISVPWLDGLFGPEPTILKKPALAFLATSAPIMPKKNDQKAKNKSPAAESDHKRQKL